MFLSELKRGFNRSSFKVSLCIGILFVLIHIWEVYPISQAITGVDEYIKAYIITSYENFMSFQLSKSGNVFIILLPILSSIAYSDSYIEDIQNGFNNFIYTREKKSKYVIHKYAANFIISGSVISIPLLLDFIGCTMIYPSVHPHSVLGGWYIVEWGLFPELFSTNPIMYIVITVGIYFLFAGAFSSMALASGIFIRKRFIVVVVPFICSMGISLLSAFTKNYKYDPSYFLYGNASSLFIIIGEFMIISIITFTIFYYGVRKYEG